MRALARAGRTAEALTVYQRTRERLAEELGTGPSGELSALHTALLRGELGERAENGRTNLRAELTSFVGRDDDVAAVAALVAGHRLVTLTGPGGSGKTRLATETARTMLAELPDGAWLVELASVPAGGEPAQAALTAIGLRDQALLGGARIWCARTSAPTRTPCRPWRGSAGRSTGSRWRSNRPRHACAPCPSISWHTGSMTGSGC
ncbi:BTAD domain-containing putative transcriptional regulator [Microbispora sp. NPDC049633]|uniref:AfsR/SARP family transcriptional regulator n=1 Tax=Microbispora sp. NPDC049633 TaxID=3154355 RepID=UPI00341E872C